MRARLSILVLTLFAGYTSAAARFEPAAFGKYEAQFIRSITFPAGTDDVDVTINCSGRVLVDGKLVTGHCDGEDEYPQFHKAVFAERAHRKTRIRPGRAEGRKREVWFQFAVHFQKTEGNEQLTVRPNHGHSTAELGTMYSSPQRYESGYMNRGRCGKTEDGQVSSLVSAGGSVISSDVVEGSPNPHCDTEVKASIKRSKYIPAFKDGGPAEAVVVERF